MTISSFFDLVAFTTATTGTGTLTVGSAVAGCRTPATAGIADGTTVSYAIKDGSNYESGVGVYTVSGTTLSRTPLNSSNSNSAINLSGSATVALTILAEDLGAIGGVAQLNQIITTGSQASVDFTSIPSGWTNLQVVWDAQDTASGSSFTQLFMRTNNDSTSGNYSGTYRIGASNQSGAASNVAASSGGNSVGAIPASGNTNLSGAGELVIPSYARTVFQKNFVSKWGSNPASAPFLIFVYAGTWKSTSAVTRLTFTTDGTAFTNGSVFTLYGMK